MERTTTVACTLEIVAGSDPIAGTLTSHDGAARVFTGWQELTCAIEQARAARAVAAPGSDETSR